jgi:hypothetical protein
MADRRRVLVPQALGADQFLRVTWHDGRRLMVVSHWEGDHCVAATPVRVDQLGELAELVVTAFARSVEQAREAGPGDVWPAPRAGDVVFVDRPSSGAEARPA